MALKEYLSKLGFDEKRWPWDEDGTYGLPEEKSTHQAKEDK